MKNKKSNKKTTKKKGKKKQNNNLNIRLISIIAITLIVLSFVAFIFKMSDGNHILKSEYTMNEPGYLDKIEVTLKKANYIHNETGIEVTFEITNRTNNTITITPDDYFKFYDINEVQIPNKYTSNTKIVKKDETILYKLQYDITKKELYEIYFYSQVVENNIKFSFKTSDISKELAPEKNIDTKDVD